MMMTEAEALEMLTREDPAAAGHAKAALRWLTSDEGLDTISLLRLQEFLWYVLPSTWPLTTAGHLEAARALGRLLALAGLDRYAEICSAPETERIIAAYGCAHEEGIAAYTEAVEASNVAPPDTDLLAWSSVMGPEERAAYDACAAAVELAVTSGELRVGASGWRTKRAALVDRWLTGHTLTGHTPGGPGGHAPPVPSLPGMPDAGDHADTSRPSTDTWLSRISTERIDEWTHGRPGERAKLARHIVPRLLEPPMLPGEPLPTLRWLLHHADAGLRLTARHYIAPPVVGEAVELFGWREQLTGRRRQELDVFPLHTLRSLAHREMGAIRRSGTSLVLTRTGRLMAADAAVRWHIGTAALIGQDDGPVPDFPVAVREAALLVTLTCGPLSHDDLAGKLTDLHAGEGWTSRSGSSLAAAVRNEIHLLRHRLRALQLIEDGSAFAAPLMLTETGTAAALSALLARALRPRHQPAFS
ncbi:MAG: hypothetical protein JOY82_25050 [Streptosporangiaceae bacterium]|nr:hypothetical protein [Streptosporangiaceae bacterium]MBV9857754.1 hypothetical protein [Streptosporangiaceae bacterium]